MRRISTILALTVMVGAALPALAGEVVPAVVVDLAHGHLNSYGRDPVIIAAVKARNQSRIRLADIAVIDQRWRNEPGVTPFMQELMASACAQRLLEIRTEDSYCSEIFVMDRLGAIVAMTDRTSDYWQGDEAKFQRSYNDGAGAVFIAEVEYDDSTTAFLCQVSVPVYDGDTVIGAITFGVNMDIIEAMEQAQAGPDPAKAVTVSGK